MLLPCHHAATDPLSTYPEPRRSLIRAQARALAALLADGPLGEGLGQLGPTVLEQAILEQCRPAARTAPPEED